MGYHHADANPSVAIAAMKGAERTEEALIEMLSYVGKLPRNLELFAAESTLRSMAADMGKALSRVKAGEITLKEADELVGRIARQESARHQRALPSP